MEDIEYVDEWRSELEASVHRTRVAVWEQMVGAGENFAQDRI
jgi:hypothetical protein